MSVKELEDVVCFALEQDEYYKLRSTPTSLFGYLWWVKDQRETRVIAKSLIEVVNYQDQQEISVHQQSESSVFFGDGLQWKIYFTEEYG